MRCCEGCGKPLPADAAPRKRFCSAECERRSYYEGRRDKDHAREEAEEGIPAGAAKAPAGRGFGGGYFERCCKWCGKAFGTQSRAAMYCCREHKHMALMWKKQNAAEEKKARKRSKYRPFVERSD